MPDFLRLALAAVLGAAFALGAGFAWLRGSAPSTAQTTPSAAPSPGSAADVTTDADLRNQVRLANIELDLARISEELERLRDGLDNSPAAPASANDGLASATVASASGPAGAVVASVESLAEAGLAPADARAMIERLDELALARLEADFLLRQATGESARQAQLDRRAIPGDSEVIRKEFGDRAYDQYLYAMKQTNRVEVASVLRESAAANAGVKSGDLLRSLDGEPLFSVRDLTRRIREGDPGRTYSLILQRDGERVEVWVPGGPLGVRVNGLLTEPDG